MSKYFTQHVSKIPFSKLTDSAFFEQYTAIIIVLTYDLLGKILKNVSRFCVMFK